MSNCNSDKSNNSKHPYVMTDAGLFWIKEEGLRVRLTNFQVRIATEIIEDNGAEATRFYELDVTLNGDAHRFTVPSTEFASLRWVDRELGAKAIIASGPALRDKTREAIQLFSQDRVILRRIFTHSGWRQHCGADGRTTWIYLYHGGAIGDTNVETRLPARLERYQLPSPPATNHGGKLPEGRNEAVITSLGFLDIAPTSMTLPMLAAVYTAPLGEVLPNDFALWMYGPTGSRKSAVAALALNHFGSFTRDTVPANFTATANALEIHAFSLKDVLMVVDDYSPASKDDPALRLLRALGDNHGRARATSTGGLQQTRYPRALVMVTAELEPPGSESAFARTFTVRWDRGKVDLPALTEAQREHSLLYSQSMAAYLSWLAPQIDNLKEELPQKMSEYRNRFGEYATHGRVAESAAKLMIGFSLFLRFAVECDAIDENKAEGLSREAFRILAQAAQETSALTEQEQPQMIALRLLASAFENKSAYLTNRDGDAPAPPAFAGVTGQRYGWPPPHYDHNGDPSYSPKPGSTRIGWTDEEGNLYLDPETTFEKIYRISASQGKPFPLRSARNLGISIKESGLLAQTDPDRTTIRARSEGKIHSYWLIDERHIWPEQEETQSPNEDPFADDIEALDLSAQPGSNLAQLHGW
ncbi:MAG: DUF927 domain-containing protein [Armatimonadetes bacterium]|nr:DUF927 domain-containing protein [Armatimonadota bacterium]